MPTPNSFEKELSRGDVEHEIAREPRTPELRQHFKSVDDWQGNVLRILSGRGWKSANFGKSARRAPTPVVLKPKLELPAARYPESSRRCCDANVANDLIMSDKCAGSDHCSTWLVIRQSA